MAKRPPPGPFLSEQAIGIAPHPHESSRSAKRPINTLGSQSLNRFQRALYSGHSNPSSLSLLLNIELRKEPLFPRANCDKRTIRGKGAPNMGKCWRHIEKWALLHPLKIGAKDTLEPFLRDRVSQSHLHFRQHQAMYVDSPQCPLSLFF